MVDPYAAPKAPIDQPGRREPTTAHLIGGLIQLCGGTTCIILGLASGKPAGIACGLFIGLFSGFFGVRAIYRFVQQ